MYSANTRVVPSVAPLFRVQSAVRSSCSAPLRASSSDPSPGWSARTNEEVDHLGWRNRILKRIHAARDLQISHAGAEALAARRTSMPDQSSSRRQRIASGYRQILRVTFVDVNRQPPCSAALVRACCHQVRRKIQTRDLDPFPGRPEASTARRRIRRRGGGLPKECSRDRKTRARLSRDMLRTRRNRPTPTSP